MKTTMKTVINAPASTVFLWLEDDERLKQWIPNLVEDEPLIETPEKVGSRFRQVFLENGKEIEMIGEITRYVEDERLQVFMTGKMFDLDVDYILKPLSTDQTELIQESQIKLKGLFKLVTPLMILMSKFSNNNPQAEAHAKLKEMAEQEYQSSTG